MASKPQSPEVRAPSGPLPDNVNPLPKKGFMGWLNKRMPVEEFFVFFLFGFFVLLFFFFWFFFGSLAGLVLVMQLITCIFLTMFYKPGEVTAFDAVEFIMREVDLGLLIRYLHS